MSSLGGQASTPLLLGRAWILPVLIVFGAILVGCSGQPRRDTPASISTPPGESTGEAGTATPPATPAAVILPAPDPVSDAAYQILVDRALVAQESGDLEGALAQLERAQRIAPGNAQIYLELSRAHRAAGNVTQAVVMAQRGMLYCRAAECGELQRQLDP